MNRIKYSAQVQFVCRILWTARVWVFLLCVGSRHHSNEPHSSVGHTSVNGCRKVAGTEPVCERVNNLLLGISLFTLFHSRYFIQTISHRFFPLFFSLHYFISLHTGVGARIYCSKHLLRYLCAIKWTVALHWGLNRLRINYKQFKLWYDIYAYFFIVVPFFICSYLFGVRGDTSGKCHK